MYFYPQSRITQHKRSSGLTLYHLKQILSIIIGPSVFFVIELPEIGTYFVKVDIVQFRAEKEIIHF